MVVMKKKADAIRSQLRIVNIDAIRSQLPLVNIGAIRSQLPLVNIGAIRRLNGATTLMRNVFARRIALSSLSCTIFCF